MTITSYAARRYPEDWPVPQIQGHGGVIDAGMVRSQQQGFPEQWRFTPSSPTRVSMVFRVPRAEWVGWLTWVNTYAVANWAILPYVDQYESIDPSPTYDYGLARFVGRMRMTPLGEDYVDVSCLADVYPAEASIGIDGNGGGGKAGLEIPVECIPYDCSALTRSLDGWTEFLADSKPATPGDVFPVNTGTRDMTIAGGSMPVGWNTNYDFVDVSADTPYDNCAAGTWVFQINAINNLSVSLVDTAPIAAGAISYTFAAVMRGLTAAGAGEGYLIWLAVAYRGLPSTTTYSVPARVFMETRVEAGQRQNRFYLFSRQLDGLNGDRYAYTPWFDSDSSWKLMTVGVSISELEPVFNGNVVSVEADVNITAALTNPTDGAPPVSVTLSGRYSQGVWNTFNGPWVGIEPVSTTPLYLRRGEFQIAGLYTGTAPDSEIALALNRNKTTYTPPLYCAGLG